MNRILNKLMQCEVLNKENKASYIQAVVIMGIFTFVFLGAEYLYVNMISLSVSGNKAVMAQNYALGISAFGFFDLSCFLPFLQRYDIQRVQYFHYVSIGFVYFLHLPSSIL